MMICLFCSQHPHDELDKGHLWRRQIRGGVGAMVGRRRLFRCRLASSCKPGSSLLVWNRVFCFFFYPCIEIARPCRFLEKETRENTLSAVRAPCFLHAHETAEQTQTNLTPSFRSWQTGRIMIKVRLLFFLTDCSIFVENSYIVLFFQDEKHCAQASGREHD